MTWKDYKMVGRDVLKDVERVSINYFDNDMISFGIKFKSGFIETYDLSAKDNQLQIQRGGIYCPGHIMNLKPQIGMKTLDKPSTENSIRSPDAL